MAYGFLTHMELTIQSGIKPPTRKPSAPYQKRISKQMAQALGAMQVGQSVFADSKELATAIRSWFIRRGIACTSESENAGFRIWRKA